MIYAIGAAAYLILAALFVFWWSGIQKLNEESDATFHRYVNEKTAKESRERTAPEQYLRKRGAR